MLRRDAMHLNKTDRKFMQTIMGTTVKTGVIALALALVGCGGGGGGTPAADAPVAGAPVGQRTVQGTAAKGLIKGAKVNVHEIDAQGLRVAAVLATAITGADGSYKLQLPVTVRHFVIEVSAAPGAMMADEATGADLPLPEDMKLRSVVTLADGATDTYEGTVSPFTEMVARTAEAADGKLSQQAVAHAKIGVRTLLGFDPETVKPVNSNSAAAVGATEDEKNQSLALAAISKMGSVPSADCGQSTPGERISCVVTGFASAVKVKDGQVAFDQKRFAQFTQAIQAVAQDKTINQTGKDKVVGIPVVNPGPDPTPPTLPPALPPLAATKALFSSLRNNIHSLGDGDAFRATADGIKADLADNVAPLGNAVSMFSSMAVNALEAFDRYRAGTSTEESFQVWRYQMYAEPLEPLDRMGTGGGNCVIQKSPLSMRCTIISNVYLPESFYGPASYKRAFVARTLTFQPKGNSTSDFSYTTSFVKHVSSATLNSNSYDWTVTDAPPELMGAVFSGDLTFARTGNTITRITVAGRMPARMNKDGSFAGDYEDWSLNAERTMEANDVALYKFGGVFTATAAGQPSGQVEIDSASFLRMAMAGNKVVANAANELQVTLRGSMGGTSVDGTLRVSGDKQDKSKTQHMPTKLSFEGSLKHKDATVFGGKVAIIRTGFENYDATAAESDTNFVADTVEIGGALSVPNRPTLSLTLGATRTGKDSADISAQYRDGTSVINASVSAKIGERHPLVKVASADGVAFSFRDRTKPAQVTKDGVVVAEIDLTKGIISYSDGSTESLQ